MCKEDDVMQLLEEKIIKDGKVFSGNVLKVDSFLNHQIDVELLDKMGLEMKELFKDSGVTKVLTIEASGIGVGCMVARHFDCPLLFAKKSKTINIKGDVYTSKVESFTHQCTYDIIVSRDFLNENDTVLIVDDFLAKGNALNGLIDIVNQAGATLAGCGIAIEKGYQGGGDKLRAQGIRVESMAIVEEMNDATGEIIFRK
jgi:xanthine phosphoribosyltransferase